MHMKKIFLVSALVCLFAQLGLAQNSSPSYIWSAERKVVEKDGIKYRYIEVQTNKVNEESEGNLEFAESWARACQDSIFLSKDKVTEVSNRFYKRYLEALKEAEASGVYDYPVKDYKVFDITSIKYDVQPGGFEFGVGAAGILPLGEMSNIVTPLAAFSGEVGLLLGKGALSADVLLGIGRQKGDYLYVRGKDWGTSVPYVSVAGTYKYPVMDLGRDRILLTAGAGYGAAVANVSDYVGERNIIESNNFVGGLLYSVGVAYDHKRSESVSFMRGKHKKQDSYLRFRIYTDQLLDLEEKVATPMVMFSVSFVSENRRIKIK